MASINVFHTIGFKDLNQLIPFGQQNLPQKLVLMFDTIFDRRTKELCISNKDDLSPSILILRTSSARQNSREFIL